MSRPLATRPRLMIVDPRRHANVVSFDGLPVVVALGGKAQAFGKGLSLARRRASALGEWVERSVLYALTPDRYAAERELGGGCLSPRLFGLDLAGEAVTGVVPYDRERTVGWIRVCSLEGEHRWLHRPAWNEAGFYRANSNGTAVRASAREALSHAAAELLERHSFVLWWYGIERSRLFSPKAAEWSELRAWFYRRGSELTAHLLPAPTSFPVVMAAAIRRTDAGVPAAAIIGLGTGTGSSQPLSAAAVGAAQEILQAEESMALSRAAGRHPTGDLACFLTHGGAARVARLLGSTDDQPEPSRRWLACPVTAARQAGLGLWAADLHSPEIDQAGLNCMQVFSPDTLPFPSTGRGRRLDHGPLRDHLDRAGRTFASVPPLPHPLG